MRGRQWDADDWLILGMKEAPQEPSHQKALNLEFNVMAVFLDTQNRFRSVSLSRLK